MSDNNLILQENEYKSSKKSSILKNNKLTVESSFNKLISQQTSLNIIILNNSSVISLDISSIKRIFSLNQLDYKEYITLSSGKDELNINSEKHSLSESITITLQRKTEKQLNEETNDDREGSSTKEDDDLNIHKKQKDIRSHQSHYCREYKKNDEFDGVFF